VRTSRWLIFAPLAVFALFPPAAKADVLGNWTYSQSQDCGGSIEVVDNIITLHGPDYNGCSGGAHWVQIETVVPADVNTVDFDWSYQTNDGWVYDPPQYGVNGVYTLITQVNTSSGTLSVPVVEGDIFTFRQYSIDTCCQPGHLSIANLSLWDTTTTSTSTTTTTSTIAPSTTVLVEEESTTTILQTTTTLPPDTTVPEPTTTTVVEASTTTVPEPLTTVAETTTVPEVVDTIPPVVVTTVPDTTVPDTTVPDTTVPDTLPPDTLPDAPETPVTLPIDITEEIPAELVEALLDAVDSGEPLTEEQFDTAIEALGELNEEEAVALIEQLLATEVTADQAEELATNPDVLAVITEEQATEIFETIEVTQLDDTQIAELTEAIQSAPLAVQEAFESTIDIFGGFDDYVPTGSNIPVGERRTLIAIAAGATLTAAGSKIRQK
jgi:hypothetical protein